MNTAILYLDLYGVYEAQLQFSIKEYKTTLESKKSGLKDLLLEIQIHKQDLDQLDKWFDINIQ